MYNYLGQLTYLKLLREWKSQSGITREDFVEKKIQKRK